MAIPQRREAYNFRELAILCMLSASVAVPPLFWGGKSAAAQLVLSALLFPTAFFVRKLKGKFDLRGAFFCFFSLAIFVFGSGASVFYSPEKYRGLVEFLNLSACFILCFSVFNFIDSKKEIRYFGCLLLGLGILLSAIGLYDFAVSRSFGFLRLSSTFYSHIPFGEFIVYPLMLSACLLFLGKPPRKWKIFLIAANILFLVVFYFDRSRGAWISFFAVLMFLALFFFKKIANKNSLALLAATLLVSLAIIACLMQFKSYQAKQAAAASAVYSVETVRENAAVARIFFWQGAWDIFKDRPIAGGGLGSYPYYYKQHLKPPFYYSTDPHNFYLKVLAEGGIILFSAFVVFIGGFLLCIFKLLMNLKKGWPDRSDSADAILVGLAGGATASLLGNGVNFGWSYLANLIVFFLVSGIILKAGTFYGGDEIGVKFAGLAKKAAEKSPMVIFPLALILAYFGIMNFLADYSYQDAVYYSENGRPADALANMKKAADTNSLDPGYRFQLAASYLDSAKKTGNKADFSAAIDFSNQAIFWSDAPENHLLLGKIFLAEKDYQAAENSYQAALSKYPFSLDAAAELADLYLAQQRYADINLLLDKILASYKKEYILSPYYIVPDKTAVLAKISKLHRVNGTACLNEGMNEKARDEFSKADSFLK
jgi:O-antigen ligase